MRPGHRRCSPTTERRPPAGGLEGEEAVSCPDARSRRRAAVDDAAPDRRPAVPRTAACCPSPVKGGSTIDLVRDHERTRKDPKEKVKNR
jgi:hypothetical protein